MRRGKESGPRRGHGGRVKVLSPGSILASALVLIVSGILLIFRTEGALGLIRILLPALLLFLGLGAVLTYLFNRKRSLRPTLAKGLLYLLLAAFVLWRPVSAVAALIRVIGVYALINAALRLISAYLMRRDGDRVWLHYLVDGALSLAFAAVFLVHPVRYVELVTMIAGVYLILYGGTLFGDFYREISSLEPDGIHFRRHLRMPMPVWIAAFLPMRLLDAVNKLVGADPPEALLTQVKEEAEATDGRLLICLHLAPEIAMGFGHMDISLDGTTYSYGTYDESSLRLFGLVSDGVLLETPTEGYLDYCTNFRGRSLLAYTLRISDGQAQAIRGEIEALKSRCVRWRCPCEEAPDADYSTEMGDTNLLCQRVGATYYKFTKGAFKTYFAVTANCVKLADRIVGAGGFDLLGVNGLITPGTYYSYLERQLKMQGTIVVKRTLYQPEEELS